MADRAPLSAILEQLKAESGDPARAHDEVFEAAYAELRKIADAIMRGERGDHTLQPSALVNEAYLRLVGDGPGDWESRSHFFGVAARAMRQILVRHAVARKAEKRGGDRRSVTLTSNVAVTDHSTVEVIDLDRALIRLAKVDGRSARMVELHSSAHG